MTKILCIEDESDIRQVLVEELSDVGYEVVEAADGRLGLEAILQQKPDLVLCDISMPVMDGHALLETLRSDHPELADLPFIFLSALAERQHIVLGKKLGADDYLTKPVDFELLFATIESRLNQVQRMNARKEEQFVKLYRSLHTQPSDGPANAAPDHSKVRPATSTEGPSSAPETTAGTAKNLIEARVRASGGQIVAGQVQIVGLDEIKKSLGERWPSRAEQIRQVAENAIRKRLSSDDIFEISEDDEFLICFASLDEKAAAFKAQAIAREIRQKILGSDSIDPQIKENCEVAANVHKLEVTEDEIAESEDLVDLVVSRVKLAAEEARKRERETIARMVGSCRILQIPFMTAKGSQAPLAIVNFDAETRSEIVALHNARPGADDLTADIDILKLGQTSELLCENASAAQNLLLVDVSFSTLENRRLLERYQKVCASLADVATNRLALNVRGVPRESVSSRTLPLLNVLRQYSRKIAIELSELSLGNIDPRTLQTPMVTGDYHVLEASIGKSRGALRQVLSALHDSKARFLLYDVPNREEARRLLKEGVDFVAQQL